MHRFTGEPDLADVLTDPIVQALMRADGCVMRSFYDSLNALGSADMPVAQRRAVPVHREPRER
ncbi:MAG TPA: hypothetical protein VMU87_20050 [Stellaceae bacterium]|nr:hypothetical protein [Stellaceae bacterium]